MPTPSRAVAALVAFVCRRPRLVLALCLAASFASFLAAATRLAYHTSRNDLLGSGKECQRRWQAYLDEFGDDDDLVAVVKGNDRGRMRQAVEALAAGLTRHPGRFDRVFYKADLRHLESRALMLAPSARLAQIRDGFLGDLAPLLDLPLAWHALGVSGIVAEGRQRAARLRPGDRLSPSDERFFKQLAAVSRSANDVLAGKPYASPWASLAAGEGPDFISEPQYFFSGDGALCFLLARPVKERGSFTAALASVSAAREVADEVRAAFPELEIGLTGLPVLETDEMTAAERDTRLASLVALAGVALLFIAVYRGLAYPALTVAALLVGTAWAFGWLVLTVGHLNILSATFAVMLIGMGDYGVLWVMRYEQARKQGMAVEPALLHTAEHVAIGNLTAASTLALAFFAALFADFKAVAELGWIAGGGVLLCALACFTLLPALLMLCDRRGVLPFSRAMKEDEGAWLPRLLSRPRLVLALAALLTLLAGAAAWTVRYDHNLLNLQARGLESVRWEEELFRHTAGASWHAIAYTRSREEALDLKKRLEAIPEVSRVVEAVSLVPPRQDAATVRAIRDRLAALPRRGPLPHLAPDAAALARDAAALDADLARLGMAPTGLVPEAGDGETLRRFDERLAEGLLDQLHGLRAMATPERVEPDDMPPRLRERYVGASGAWLLRAFARDDLWDFAPLERFNAAVAAVHPEATGKTFTTAEGLKAMKDGLTRAGVYAFLVIVLVLWIDFRRPGRTLLAVLPLVLGVLWSVGVLGLLGFPLNPANMIAFPLILGVGVDNGVHVLHDWLLRRREGKRGVSAAIGRGVLVKALTTMIGFAALMLSTERGLAGLGLILTLGVGCSMLAALGVLPAALACLEPAGAARPAQMRQAA
ncbi:MAG: MMPL family transporter [Gemmataceae bacterium]|nr:MMPL family transporter [Gemmataceae bacterium]